MLISLTRRLHTQIVKFTEPAPMAQEEKTRFQHYIIFMMLGVPAMFSFGLFNLLHNHILISLFAFMSITGLIGGMMVLRQLTSGLWVYRINAVLYTLLITYMVMVGGDDGSKALWAYTFPLICCFLLGAKEGGTWSFVVAFIITYIFYCPTVFSDFLYSYSSDFKLRFLITYCFSTVISIWLENSRNYYQRESKQIRINLEQQQQKLRAEISSRIELEQTLMKTAQIDPLTNLYNRGAFFTTSTKEWHKHVRNHDELSFAILDLDYFKKVNDKYGHPAGDKVLIEFAKILKENVRDFDVTGRIGGEEFAILMSATSDKNANKILERIRVAVEMHQTQYEQSFITCTVSIGLYTSKDEKGSIDEVYKKADSALYQAKSKGRNQIFLLNSL